MVAVFSSTTGGMTGEKTGDAMEASADVAAEDAESLADEEQPVSMTTPIRNAAAPAARCVRFMLTPKGLTGGRVMGNVPCSYDAS
jgi:hypothetical protein